MRDTTGGGNLAASRPVLTGGATNSAQVCTRNRFRTVA